MSTQLFPDLRQNVENEEGTDVSEMESLCLRCHANGTTKILLTRIPFFKEVVLMSFECHECGWINNELQPAAEIQKKGSCYRLKCRGLRDLSRQVVKTEWAEVSIPEVEFEVKKQNGLITTVEGLIDRAIEGLNEALKRFVGKEPETVLKLTQFIARLAELKEGNIEFTLVIDDPTGNSYIENPAAPESDPNLEIKQYDRTHEQNKLIGLLADDDVEDKEAKEEDLTDNQKLRNEVLQLATNCSSCNAPCFTNMKVTEIPHFKDVVIMATNCEVCGHRTNEVKSGSGIEDKGVRLTVNVKGDEQLRLEVVKSDTCSVIIPELELELSSSGSGRYTTIEGLVENMRLQLKESNPFVGGDSATTASSDKINTLLEKLKKIIGYTVILDDPCGNSFVENADLTERYERTWEQNEYLGLNDIKTENYQ